MVQGNTVSAIGSYKGLKEVRRIAIDCIKNIHPIYHIKELMIKRELAKDEKLKTESWDRFLPKFRKQNKKSKKESKKDKKTKKEYTPFPPAQQPRKEDLQIESGEWFLRPEEKKAKEIAKKKETQAVKKAEKNLEREKLYMPPEEESFEPQKKKKKVVDRKKE